MKQMNTTRGNVLFLVLIAVALFAALSYAVTSSSRSGGGTANETSALAASQITQYINSVRTAVTRMVINGVDPREVYFNPPSNFSGPTNKAVFHVNGGGAVYQKVQAKFFDASLSGALSGGTAGNDQDVVYSGAFMIDQIGSTPTNASADPSGNDIIAFVDGLNSTVCQAINKQLYGDQTIPVLNGTGPVVTLPTTTTMMYGTTFPTSATYRLAASGTNPAATVMSTTADPGSGSGTVTAGWMAGKAAGCFRNGTGANGRYVYFHVLYER